MNTFMMTDREILNWLEDNIAYVMIGADLEKGRMTSGTLDQTPEDSGKGWRNGKLRRAVVQAMEKDRERKMDMLPAPGVMCELEGHKGMAREAAGYYQVFDGKSPTMNRPAAMCSVCVEFARECGMTPKRLK